MNLGGIFSKKEKYPDSTKGEDWLELEEPLPVNNDVESHGLSSVHVERFSVRDGRETMEPGGSSFVETPRPPLHVWYRPTCSPAWVIPIGFITFVLMVVVIVDISFDDYYHDLVAALVAAIIFFVVVSFYYIGRFLDSRYSPHYAIIDIFFRYVCFPIGCMRVNATNIYQSASAPPGGYDGFSKDRRKPSD